jgi:GNAT superfamily N-acetyltransferase
MADIAVRVARKTDFARVAEVERACLERDDPDFGKILPMYAWAAEDFRRETHSRAALNCLWEGPVLVGYFLFRCHRREIEVVRLGVDPDFRGVGFGEAALHWLVVNRTTEAASVVTATVPETDVATCRWFARRQFHSQLAPNWFSGGVDGVRFTCDTRPFHGTPLPLENHA